MSVTVGIVGIDRWKELSKPCIDSILSYESGADIVIVDNASKTPYPSTGDAKVVRVKKRVGYAEAMNKVLFYAQPSDWYILINDDVLCEAPFIRRVEAMEPGLYGLQMNGNNLTKEYIDGWFYLIHSTVIGLVGRFDPAYKVAGWEDVDYCHVARTVGFIPTKIELPFRHIKGQTRFAIPEYDKIRASNRRYFEEKHGLKAGHNTSGG